MTRLRLQSLGNARRLRAAPDAALLHPIQIRQTNSEAQVVGRIRGPTDSGGRIIIPP
jgi:hypothetical protein